MLFGPSGSSSAPELIEYITNGKFESDVSDWSTYADAAGVQPVDGTGGTANITFTRTTSTPLVGTGSGLITKDAANRQGEGISTDFTIDEGLKSKVLRISALYEASANFAYNAGTAADPSDIVCYLYDVTNTQIIQPISFTLDGSGSFVSEFQAASDSTSYRLIFHVATTNASAWTFKIDNISVGPREISRGPIITDWASYTPTGSFTTNTTYTGKWRRVGDEAEIQVELEFSGAPNSTTLNTISLPSGFSIDTGKLSFGTSKEGRVGSCDFSNTSTSYFPGWIVLDASTANTVRPFYTTSDTAAAPAYASNVTQAAPFSFGTGDRITMTFKVPIQGWGSNTVLSSDQGLRLVSGRFSTVTARTINNTAPTIIYETVEKDSHGTYNATTGEYTIPEPGDYEVGGGIRAASASYSGGNLIGLYIYVNGSLDKVASSNRFDATITSTKEVFGSVLVTDLKAGDIVTWRVYSDTASTLQATQADFNTAWIVKKQSPQTIGMNEFVGASYNTLTSTTITAGTPLKFTTEVYDSHGAFAMADGLFTAPVSGYYRVGMTGLNTGTDNLYRVEVNGADATGLCGYSSTAVVSAMWATVKVDAGDTIEVNPNSSVTASSTTCQVYFERIN